MAKGFQIDVATSKMEFVNGSRTVHTTAGKLITLLPTEYTFSAQTLTFPDFSKDELYVWTMSNLEVPNSAPDNKYQHGESCASFITAVPQEYSNVSTLMAAPTGADFFMGWAKISRTTAPANSWQGRTLAVLPVENQWMPISGAMSALMEAELGMARAMHIYISGGNLVMEAEQSVGAATGGYTGNTNGVAGFSRTNGSSYNDRGNALYKTTPGIVIHKRDSKSYGYTSPAGGYILAVYNSYERGGSNPCARSDTTVYTSVYSVDIKGRFGRRS